MKNSPGDALSIALRQEGHDWVMPFFRAFRKEEAGQHRRDDDREDQSAEQSKGNRPRHGFEEASFYGLQREYRQVGRDDDRDGIEDGPLDFVGRFGDPYKRTPPVLVAGKMADDVFHHDHRAIDDHAEVQRSKRKQVRRNMPQIKANSGKEQRKWNRERNE